MKILWRPMDRAHHPIDSATRMPEIHAFWKTLFPDSVPSEDSDLEDFGENAALGHALHVAGIEHEILPDRPGIRSVSGHGWGVSDPAGECAYMFGAWQKSDGMLAIIDQPRGLRLVGCGPDEARFVSRYMQSKTFLRHAGRPMILAGGDVDGETGIEAALAAIAATGADQVFVKTLHKQFSRLHNLRCKNGRYYHATFAGDEDMEWFPVTHEGDREALVVQGPIEPTYEYRMVVIDHEVVTGAGCIERMIPCDATGDFDVRMERVRNRSQTEERPDILDRYRDFAATFVNEYCEEAEAHNGQNLGFDHPAHWPLCYSLDLCLDARTGNVVPIELNPSQGFGIYASNAINYVRAIEYMMITETARLVNAGVTRLD